jgi:putative tricarboxylic transport membrane protein
MAMTRPYWLGAGVLFLGIVWIHQALQLPIRAQYAEMGPGFFLLLVGAGPS